MSAVVDEYLGIIRLFHMFREYEYRAGATAFRFDFSIVWTRISATSTTRTRTSASLSRLWETCAIALCGQIVCIPLLSSSPDLTVIKGSRSSYAPVMTSSPSPTASSSQMIPTGAVDPANSSSTSPPGLVSRMSHLPLVGSAIWAYEQGKASSRVVKVNPSWKNAIFTHM